MTPPLFATVGARIAAAMPKPAFGRNGNDGSLGCEFGEDIT